jgi:hypothetical protein
MVAACMGTGMALVNETGFFAQETQAMQMFALSTRTEVLDLVIDRPFLVFFASDYGVHAAAWFRRDAFRTIAPAPSRVRRWLARLRR